MKAKIGKTMGVLALSLVLSCVLVSLAQATDETAGRNWANNNLDNKNKAVSIPVWKITRPGKANSVRWDDYGPNKRFAIYDVDDDNSGGAEYYSDDLVLDKETGLIWTRNAYIQNRSWAEAILFCRTSDAGHRRGWRLPTIEELASLLEGGELDPALPKEHPFINIQTHGYYWSSSTDELDSKRAWIVRIFDGWVTTDSKTSSDLVYWPVRGGNGYATGGW